MTPGPESQFAVATPSAVGAYGSSYSAPSDAIDPMLQLQLEREKVRVYHDVPWYETWAGIAVILLFIWPLGLFVLWRSAVPTTKQKWAVTAGVLALIVFNVVRFMLGMMAAVSSAPMPPLP